VPSRNRSSEGRIPPQVLFVAIEQAAQPFTAENNCREQLSKKIAADDFTDSDVDHHHPDWYVDAVTIFKDERNDDSVRSDRGNRHEPAVEAQEISPGGSDQGSKASEDHIEKYSPTEAVRDKTAYEQARNGGRRKQRQYGQNLCYAHLNCAVGNRREDECEGDIQCRYYCALCQEQGF